MNEIIFQIDEAPEGGYTAKALGHAIFTEADTLDALRSNVRDAVRCHAERDPLHRRKRRRWRRSR